MHSIQTWSTVFLIIVATASVGASVPPAAATESTAVTQTVTVHLTPDEPGSLDVELTYDLRKDLEYLMVNVDALHLEDADYEMRGFKPLKEHVAYRWDGQTSNPTISATIDANQTNGNVGGLDEVDAGEWSFIGFGRHSFTLAVEDSTGGYNTGTRPEAFDLRFDLKPGGYVGNAWTYIGPYDRWKFATPDHQFTVVVPESASLGPSREKIEQALHRADLVLGSPVRSDISVFVAPNPIRRGGVMRHTVSERYGSMTVHQSSPAYGTWIHEFVHTQTASRAHIDRWYIEAVAEYMQIYVALDAGHITYEEYLNRVRSVPDSHQDDVLGRQSEWHGSHYTKGARVLAALDAKIRTETDGERSFIDLFQSLRSPQLNPDQDTLGDVASDVANTNLRPWLDRYLDTSQSASVPDDPALFFSNSTDTDGDGLVDLHEAKFGSNYRVADADDDGLADRIEYQYRTDPRNSDSDGDELIDSEEHTLGFNPTDPDTDGDTVWDGKEHAHGSDPLAADTDGDGLQDDVEYRTRISPVRADTDQDGLNDGQEERLGTNPLSADTDGDTRPDGEEVDAGTNPRESNGIYRFVSQRDITLASQVIANPSDHPMVIGLWLVGVTFLILVPTFLFRWVVGQFKAGYEEGSR